jgi:hypothetical protein
MDSATGIEPPMACRNRAAIRVSIPGARLHSSDPMAKITRPV